jgi:hypothetical protein
MSDILIPIVCLNGPGTIISLSIQRRPGKITPLAREAFPAHMALAVATAPLLAMTQYAAYLSVKTFRAPQWVPAVAGRADRLLTWLRRQVAFSRAPQARREK